MAKPPFSVAPSFSRISQPPSVLLKEKQPCITQLNKLIMKNNIRIAQLRCISTAKDWLQKEYSCFDFVTRSILTLFDVVLGSLGIIIILRNSSSVRNNTSSRQSFH